MFLKSFVGINNKKKNHHKGDEIMSVHFFYNYKDDLVKKLKEHYAGDIKRREEEKREQGQLDDAAMTAASYFKDMASELAEVIDSSNGGVKISINEGGNIVEFAIDSNYLKMTRKEKSIEVVIGTYVEETDMTESVVLGYIVPGEKKAITKKIGKIHDGSHFDENALNYYLRSAFGSVFKGESGELMDA